MVPTAFPPRTTLGGRLVEVRVTSKTSSCSTRVSWFTRTMKFLEPAAPEKVIVLVAEATSELAPPKVATLVPVDA